MKTRCLIYAHWDVNGFVDPYVIHALQQYRPSVDRIVFVTTNYQLRSRDVEAVADEVIVRENTGFDFESWRQGLQAVGADTFDEVVFANSSVYGPVWPFERLLLSPVTRNGGVWGMTISQQHTPHLQSYFMTMSRELLASAAGKELWGDIVPLRHKTDVIEAYELQWMGKCVAAGVPVSSFFDSQQFPTVPVAEQLANIVRWPLKLKQVRRYRKAVRRGPSNPTHLQWKQMLECGAPFVKVDLFSRNPYCIRLSRVYDWLEEHTDYPTALIRNHQARLRRQPAAA
jgi:lipopolysaccharide biosynthesis protein